MAVISSPDWVSDMVLKRRISYQWRLFLPWVIIMWAIIVVLAAFQYNREREYRIDNIKEQLSLVNHRIIDAYENDIDLIAFMQFLGQYYADNELFAGMRITVFNEDNVPIYSIGAPLQRLSSGFKTKEEIIESERSGVGRFLWASVPRDDSSGGEDREFLFASQRSADGKTAVFTSLPYSMPVADALSPGSGMWIFIVILSIIVTVIAFITTSVVSKNVTLLRDFAQRAARDKDFIADDEFPHDELGDISRQIVHIYREKIKAIEVSEAEHTMAMNATEEKLRIKKQLTNNVSHELKTPVGAIKGYIDSIADHPEMDEDMRKHFIEKAQEHMERLCALLNDLSTITRLEEGADNIMTEAVDMYKLINNIAGEIETTFVDSSMSFENELSKDCVVEGNASLLYGAMMNLVRNAIAYSHGTEMGIRCAKRSNKFLTFEFWDNGVGVAEEYIPHLFDRFFRVDTGRSRKSGGTGLGLPIVQSTVQSHGGYITVRNRADGGLLFSFTLRRFADSPAEN